MEIKNLRLDFAPGQVVNPSENQNGRQRAQGSFDSFLSEAENRQNRQDFQTSERIENRPREERTEQEPVVAYEPAENKELPASEEEYEGEVAYTPVYEEHLPMYEAALHYIADALSLPANELVQWLKNEDIKLYELQEPGNLPKFIEYVIGEAEPAEILTAPKLPEVYKALKETMEILHEPEKVHVQKEPTVVLQEAAKSSTPVIRAEIENVEVVEEDGEVVVTPKKGVETIEARGSQQHSPKAAVTERGGNPVEPDLPPPVKPASNEAAALEQTAPQTMQQSVEATQQTTKETPTAQVNTPVNAQDVINQIMSQVKVSSTGQNFTEMRITLKPESLGEIVLRVMTQNGIVMAQFEAENQRVKEALESNFNQLRDALADAGLTFGELNVYVRQDGSERLHQFERERQAARRRMEQIQAEEVPGTNDPLHTGILDVVV